MKIIPPDKLMDFIHAAEQFKMRHHTIREGQAYMNVLFEMYPEIYKRIDGTEYDCFYDDSRIFHFFSEIS